MEGAGYGDPPALEGDLLFEPGSNPLCGHSGVRARG